MRPATLPFLFLFFLLKTCTLPAQSWHFQQYSVGEGLPQSQVYALLMDSRGYLWMGTQGGGLARFDGKTFRNYSSREGLTGNYVQALAEDAAGNIWIGTNRGLSRFDGAVFQNFELEKGWDIPVNGMAFDPADATLWLATDAGIFHKTTDSTGTVFSKIKEVNGTQMGKMFTAFADRKGTLWLGGELGIFKKEKASFKHVWRRKAEVLSFTEMPDGQLIAGVFHLGILRFDGQKWSIFNQYQGLPSNKVQCVWQAPTGELWVATQDRGVAICRWQLAVGNWQVANHLTTAEGLCNLNIRTMLGDPWGNVWLGTSGSGVCKFGGQEFQHFDVTKGLRSNFVYSLCRDTSGGLWLSAGDRGISFFDGRRFKHFGADSGFVNVKCRALLQDRAGRLWIGTEGNGLALFQNGVFRFFSKKNGLAGNWIRDILEDPAGHLWVATTDGGISKIIVNDPASGSLVFQNFGFEKELEGRAVNDLHIDRKGRLWFAVSTGKLGCLEGEKTTFFDAKNGLPDVAVFRSLAEDSLGYLWVGTAGGGIARAYIYEDKKVEFNTLSQTDGLASANIYLLQFDRAGNLWAGSETGVDRLALDAGRNLINVRHFAKAEGFRGIETCQNASILDDRGSLWFGTVNGLTRYRPAADSIVAPAPQALVTGVRLFYEPLQNTTYNVWATAWGGLKNGAVFPYDQNHLGFEFFAADFTNPDKVEYSWQLVGSESDWSPFSTRREVSYANLPPKEYTFRLRAKNPDGTVGQALETSFTIEPPFWATWWFRLTAIGGGLALIGGWFWGRLRLVRRKAAQEREQLEMQNRILTLEQKARQLQMNPHFIFNALNSIQSLVSAGDTDRARQYILKFGKLMRAVLDNSRQPLISLEKEILTLRQYLEMEQFCRNDKFDFELHTEAVEPSDLQIPPMLLQPFVENAILHGIAPLSQRRGRIDIYFSENGHLLEVTIRDNGVGFEQSLAKKTGLESGRQSAGIAVTKERIELLAGGATVEMRQVAGVDGEVEGTEVRVTLPAS